MSKTRYKQLYIISTSDEPNNVIFGHAIFAKTAGFEPVFVFPRRSCKRDFSGFYTNYKTIYLDFTFDPKNFLTYSLSIILLIFFVTRNFFFKRRAKYFLAIDMVGTIGCILIKLRGAHIFTLVNDNFSASYAISPRAYVALRIIESWVLCLISNVCIFPDKSRYVLLGSPNIRKVHYVPNVLSDEYSPTYKGSSANKLVVMFCGWLVPGRGMELLEDMVDQTTDSVEFLLVGSGDDSLLNHLSAKKRISYVGHVDRNANLDLMSVADINVAFYSPRILINRFALPQKIYDSLMIGCPLFVNSEVQMSIELHKSGSCFTAQYFDLTSICQKLNELASDKKQLKDMSKAMANYRAHNANFAKTKTAGHNVYRGTLIEDS